MLKAGERLKEERLRKGITLEEASSATKIRLAFLSSIEKSEYDKLPSVAYAQGFVRNYSRFLGLSDREILALFRREYDSAKAYRVLPKGFSKESDFPLRRLKIRNTFVLGFLVFIVLGIYIGLQYRSVFFGPSLSVSAPKENSIISTHEVIVRGQTSSDATVFINDQPVSVGDDGSFVKDINVFSGENKIIIKSVNRFGKEVYVSRIIQVK